MVESINDLLKSGTANSQITDCFRGAIIIIFALNEKDAIECQTMFGRPAMRWEIQLVFDNYGETTTQ